MISATLFRNGVGARSFGHLDIRNSIVTENRRGLLAAPAETLLSRYNDLFANKEASYDNVVKGTGDLAAEVSFLAADSGDLRVPDASAPPTTAIPADDFSREPAPNGGRVNLGAYAGTEQAESSQTNSQVGATYVPPALVRVPSTGVDPAPTPGRPVSPLPSPVVAPSAPHSPARRRHRSRLVLAAAPPARGQVAPPPLTTEQSALPASGGPSFSRLKLVSACVLTSAAVRSALRNLSRPV